MNRHPNLVAIVCGAVLILSLLGLGAALLVTLDQWRHGFDRAGLSQAQLAAASEIEARVYAGEPIDRLDMLLARYRGLIAAETRLIGDAPGALRGQRLELAQADRLARLAHGSAPGDKAELRRLVAVIVPRERAEAQDVSAALERLRRRMTLLVLLLAGAGGGAALLGAWGLVRANRRLAREVAERTAQIAAIDRARRLFFAKVSHELRTPVTVMRGEAEVALADPAATPAMLSDALRNVVANAEFLGHRVEELLQLARADEGQLVLEPAPLDFAALIGAAAAATDRYARSVDVSLALDLPDAPVIVHGDARWLGQAIVAVVDNGIKFSPAGAAVALRLRREGDRATLEVADHGPGVAAPELPRIFDAYYQAEAGRQRGGTGLGLALARWVVERHGGSIAAANDTRGCVISFTLPCAA